MLVPRHRTAEEMRIRQMSVAEAAYVAGVVDGEGTISLTRATPTANRPKRYVPRLQIANTDLALLDRLNRMVGGGRLDGKNRRAHIKTCYALTWMPVQIRALLPQLHPYLCAKQRQAEAVLRYVELVDQGARGATDQSLEEIERIRQEITRLNHRGVRTEAGSVPFWEPAGPLAPRPLYREQCEHCGGPMSVLMPHKRFCSDQCQSTHYYENIRHPAEEAALWHTETCQGCGTQFETNYASRHFCGRPCYLRHRRAEQAKERVVEKQCPICGATFTSGNSRKTYCKASCVTKACELRKKPAT